MAHPRHVDRPAWHAPAPAPPAAAGWVNLGLALAHRSVKELDTLDGDTDAHTRFSEDLAPLVRVAGGVLVGEGPVGAALTVAYVHAAPVSDFDAVHNDGGVALGVALRVRGLR